MKNLPINKISLLMVLIVVVFGLYSMKADDLNSTIVTAERPIETMPSEFLREALKKQQLEYERIQKEMDTLKNSIHLLNASDKSTPQSELLVASYEEYSHEQKEMISEFKIGYEKITRNQEDWTVPGGSDEVKSIRALASDKLYTSFDVYYATNRQAEKSRGKNARYGTNRDNEKLTKYGVTNVSIPLTHEVGEIEEPSIWRFEFNDAPEKHITIHTTDELGVKVYFQRIKESINKSKGQNALVFVHGYNVSFEDAAKRTAQMAYDLEFEGIPAFYSWPSQAKVSSYTIDEANIKWSQPHIESFLESFASNSGAENIYLIAHSMGSRGLTNAYISAINKTPSLKSKFKEIILAAPDIDADIFKEQIAPKMAKIGIPVTLYASSEDNALKASHKIHGTPRAGDSGVGQLILEGVESIDSTNVKSDFIGHSSYSDNIAVLSDLYYLINRGLRPDQRRGLIKHRKDTGMYWKFKKVR